LDRSGDRAHYRAMHASSSNASRWAQSILLVVTALGLGGCTCSLFELDGPEFEGGCLLGGTPCPDGTCVASLFGGIGDPGGECCGFGGECPPCPGLWDDFECPDGTCAGSAAECCAHGGRCDPGDSDGASSSSDGSTTDATGGTASSGTASSGTAGTDDTEGSTGDSTASTAGSGGSTSGDATAGTTSEDTDQGGTSSSSSSGGGGGSG
nr:hypothetical protein [Deltaproteobacteria bacterium]